MQPPYSISSVYSRISSQDAAHALAEVPLDSALNTVRERTQQDTAISVPLGIISKVPATLEVTTHAAHVCKFSYGSGLLVYINGVLMSAACVALKVNIATLEFVKRLPLEELGAIGVCLGTAFVNDDEGVDITWAEVCEEVERAWREAEREWEPFPGGPYETYELEAYNEKLSLRQSTHRFEEHRQVGGDEWAAIFEGGSPPLQDVSVSLRMNTKRHSSLSRRGAGSFCTFYARTRPLVTDAEFTNLPDYSDSFSYSLSLCDDEDAFELATVRQPEILHESSFGLSPDKKNMSSWSPGAGDGPIMSTADFDALPDWSDVEDDPDWDGAIDETF